MDLRLKLHCSLLGCDAHFDKDYQLFAVTGAALDTRHVSATESEDQRIDNVNYRRFSADPSQHSLWSNVSLKNPFTGRFTFNSCRCKNLLKFWQKNWNCCPAESPVSVNIINSTHVMCYTALHAAPAAHQILTASTSKLHRQHWSAIIFQPSNIYPVEMNPARLGLDWPWFCVLPSLYFPDHIVLSWLLAERNIYFTLTRPRLSWLM